MTISTYPSRKLPVSLSNPDKVFWPEEGYTKLDLVEYHAAIFPTLAPYLIDIVSHHKSGLLIVMIAGDCSS